MVIVTGIGEKVIYLASPYSHPDPLVREQRFKAVCEYAANLMKDGEMVYSPIAHSHPIAQFGLPKEWEFWEQYDRFFISKCDELFVLMIDGWDKSKGVDAEIEIANELCVPVTYVGP